MQRTPFVAPTTDYNQQYSVDCGISAIKWCTGKWCQKLATIRIFLTVYGITLILQGTIQTYFRISIKQAAHDHGFDTTLTDWLLVSSSIVEGVLALIITVFYQKYHPTSWIGGFVIFQAIAVVLAIVPTLTYLPQEDHIQSPLIDLCSNNEYELDDTESTESTEAGKTYSLTTLGMLFILQLVIGLTNIVLYVIGLNYIDDNSKSTDFPVYASVSLGCLIWGAQFGAIMSIIASLTRFNWWIGWLILFPLALSIGIIISLFPKRLTQTVVRSVAKQIRNSQMNVLGTDTSNFIEDFAFIPTMKRILTNKIFMFNVIGLMLIESASINFFLQEQLYLQSRFYFPTDESNGIMDEWTSRFISYIIQPPIVGLSILICGLLIGRFLPKGRTLAVWNIAIGVTVCLIYISHIFVHCSSVKLAGFNQGKFFTPYCSRHCNCKPDVFFSPICPANGKQTYYSPCHAGCSNELIVNNVAIYQNCSCGADINIEVNDGMATSGACNSEICQTKWNIFQSFTIICASLLGISRLMKIIISIRSVLPQDKPYVLGLELTLIGIMAYVPGKLVYDSISHSTCQYWSKDHSICYVNESPLHGDLLNTITAILIAIGIIMDILVAYYATELNCYNKNEDEFQLQFPLDAMHQRNGYHEHYTRVNNREDDEPSYAPASSINSDYQQLARNENLIYSRLNNKGQLERLHETTSTTDAVPSSPDLSFSSAADPKQVVTYAQVLPRRKLSNTSEELDFRMYKNDDQIDKTKALNNENEYDDLDIKLFTPLKLYEAKNANLETDF